MPYIILIPSNASLCQMKEHRVLSIWRITAAVLLCTGPKLPFLKDAGATVLLCWVSTHPAAYNAIGRWCRYGHVMRPEETRRTLNF